MNKYPCEMIQDLIPLYQDGILSATTEEIIRQHLEECPQCRSLIEDDYPEPVHMGLGETLPEADTFKKVSKRVKRWGVYAGATIFLIVLAIGAVSYYMGNADPEPRLSVRQAVNIFAKEDIHLTKTSDPEAVEINGVKPVTFVINDTKNKLRIYRYHSIAERRTASDIWRENDGARFYYSEPNSNAKNIMCLLVPRDEKEYTREDGEVLGKVLRTVFEKLNDTQKIVYTGRGENWESKTVVQYHTYPYHEEDATLNYENWHESSTLLTYLGKDINSVGEISYDKGGGWGTGLTLDPDGTVSLGSGGGNGSIPRADRKITFTIRWNDQEETFVARGK